MAMPRLNQGSRDRAQSATMQPHGKELLSGHQATATPPRWERAGENRLRPPQEYPGQQPYTAGLLADCSCPFLVQLEKRIFELQRDFENHSPIISPRLSHPCLR